MDVNCVYGSRRREGLCSLCTELEQKPLVGCSRHTVQHDMMQAAPGYAMMAVTPGSTAICARLVEDSGACGSRKCNMWVDS